MKNIVKRLTPLMVVPFLMACGNGTTIVLSENATFIMSNQTVTNTVIALSVQKANGQTTYRISLGDKTSDTIHGDVSPKDGSVEFTVLTMEDEVLYNNEFIAEGNFDVTVPETGNYKFKIEYSDFKGSYKVSWAK